MTQPSPFVPLSLAKPESLPGERASPKARPSPFVPLALAKPEPVSCGYASPPGGLSISELDAEECKQELDRCAGHAAKDAITGADFSRQWACSPSGTGSDSESESESESEGEAEAGLASPRSTPSLTPSSAPSSMEPEDPRMFAWGLCQDQSADQSASSGNATTANWFEDDPRLTAFL